MTTPPMTDEERDNAMRRSFGRWAGINPSAVVAGSEAQAVFCIADAQHDIAALGTALSAERARANNAEATDARLIAALLDIWAISSPGSFEEADDIAEVLIKHGLAERRPVDPAENEWDADELTFLLPPLSPAQGEGETP